MARFILPTVHRLGQPAAFHSVLSSVSARAAAPPKLSASNRSRHRSPHKIDRVQVLAPALGEGVAEVQAWDAMDDRTHRGRAAIGQASRALQGVQL